MIKEKTAPPGFKLSSRTYSVKISDPMYGIATSGSLTYEMEVTKHVYFRGKISGATGMDGGVQFPTWIKNVSSPNWYSGSHTRHGVWEFSGYWGDIDGGSAGRIVTHIYGTSGGTQKILMGFEMRYDLDNPTITLKVQDDPLGGWLELTKSADAPDITDGNKCYTLQGAVYGVYSDEACTKELCRLTTDESGYVKSDIIPAGTVYVKEITAPTGYEVDDTVYPVTITSGATVQQAVTDTPANDPVGITLTKISAVDNKNLPSLAGAQFTVKYYDGQYSSVNDLPAEATRTWVIETKERTVVDKTMYMTLLDTPYKVGGDDFYTIDGNIAVPIGTMTIEETKTAFGYTMEGGYMTGSGQSVSLDNTLMADPIIATLSYSSADGFTGDNWTFERDGAHYYCNVTFTVTNTATFDMPMSGGTSGMLPALMGFSFVLVAGGILMTMKHKRKNRR